MQTGKAKTPSEAKEKLLLVMSNGEALQRFADMAKAQVWFIIMLCNVNIIII